MPIKPENRDRYPDDWPQIVAAVRKRAGDRCECRGECGTRGAKKAACAVPDLQGRCRAVHGQPNPRTGSLVVLTTAHLDDQPETRDLNLLRSMCQACHLAYDTLLHRANRRDSRDAASGQLSLGETA
jgi:hypothetical protein